jgi:pimeloyl-ACP methyl ester carboxylesterase
VWNSDKPEFQCNPSFFEEVFAKKMDARVKPAHDGPGEEWDTNEETSAMQRNGRVNSGDVSIFYRAFGARGRTPILLMHGANYFDSYDWIGVAEALATDREVASFDKRGFGETGWSPSKDYSVDANMGDILAVLTELKWERPIVAGHSASGRLTISFAANFPDKISRLVVVDSGLAREEGGARSPTGNPPLVFETVEAAMAHFAKLSNPPRIAHDRERALAALVKVDKGLMLKRDPDFQNSNPQGEGANLPQRARRDVWQELSAVKCPIMIVRGLRSDRYTPEIIARINRDYPAIEWATVDSQHDVAAQAPQALVAAIRKFAAGA